MGKAEKAANMADTISLLSFVSPIRSLNSVESDSGRDSRSEEENGSPKAIILAAFHHFDRTDTVHPLVRSDEPSWYEFRLHDLLELNGESAQLFEAPP
jgi:hypothetical protein